MLKRALIAVRIFLYHNKKEGNGVFVFMVLLFSLYLIFYLWGTAKSTSSQNKASFLAKIDSIEQRQMKEIPESEYFSFDPNHADSSTLVRLGFSRKQIQNLENYRGAGALFYRKEDFKKLYFVTDSIYAIYESYIHIPPAKKKKGKKTSLTTSKVNQNSNERVPIEVDSLFIFNPNATSIADWQRLGASKKVAQTIHNYLSKGGSFYKKEDLMKIYGLSSALYKKLEPYIRIPAEEKNRNVAKQHIVIYDLNAVTVKELQSLRLSSSISRRVVRYRQKLGGYVQMNQLLEVFNISEQNFKLLQRHCEIRSGVNKININTSRPEDLYEHPYLDFRDAEAILRYRKRKGDYLSIETLKERKILTKKTFDKVKKYLVVKNKEVIIGK